MANYPHVFHDSGGTDATRCGGSDPDGAQQPSGAAEVAGKAAEGGERVAEEGRPAGQQELVRHRPDGAGARMAPPPSPLSPAPPTRSAGRESWRWLLRPAIIGGGFKEWQWQSYTVCQISWYAPPPQCCGRELKSKPQGLCRPMGRGDGVCIQHGPAPHRGSLCRSIFSSSNCDPACLPPKPLPRQWCEVVNTGAGSR